MLQQAACSVRGDAHPGVGVLRLDEQLDALNRRRERLGHRAGHAALRAAGESAVSGGCGERARGACDRRRRKARGRRARGQAVAVRVVEAAGPLARQPTLRCAPACVRALCVASAAGRRRRCRVAARRYAAGCPDAWGLFGAGCAREVRRKGRHAPQPGPSGSPPSSSSPPWPPARTGAPRARTQA